MSTEPVSSVAGSWVTAIVGSLVSTWYWFVGEASGMTVMISIGTIVLTAIKIAQEMNAWRARDEERQALRKLWNRMGGRTRPSKLDSKLD